MNFPERAEGRTEDGNVSEEGITFGSRLVEDLLELDVGGLAEDGVDRPVQSMVEGAAVLEWRARIGLEFARGVVAARLEGEDGLGERGAGGRGDSCARHCDGVQWVKGESEPTGISLSSS
jgi:hypothetical protein